MIKLIHGADLHLDSPFSGLTPEQAAARRQEQRELLDRLARLAREREADLVLLSGDLLDSRRTYRETAQALARSLGSLPCPVFLAPGNHDFYGPQSLYAALDWPENVHIFTSGSVRRAEVPGLDCVVYGRAFLGPREDRSPLEGFRAERDGRVQLMAVHGEVDGRGEYGPISRELGLTIEEIQAAEKVIASLEPHPGRAFQPSEPTMYVRPDIFVAELDGEWKVILNEYYLPRVSISDYYARLLKESDEQETREYLQKKMQQAKWLLGSLERRGSTLRACAEAILEAQLPFFTGQTGELSPMSLSTLAESLGVHPSTVSRATRGKYLQCRQGTYPLRYFFSRAIGTQGLSQQAVKRKLLELVQGEDHAHPLSDQRLCQLLAAQGVQVARRTVAKYRLELGIRSSAGRRR